MLIVLGTPVRTSPKPWLYFPVEAVLVNALEAGGRNPREALRYGGELWMDSGGYQIMRRGLDIAVEKIAEIYRRADAQLYFSLDVPPSPQDPPEVAEKKLEKSYRNWLALSKAVDGVVPVLHVTRPELFRRYLRLYLDAPALAIGGAVPYVLTARGVPRNSRRLALELIAEARREFKGWLHVFGLGSPSVSAALEALGVDSTDSATWRLKAAYGKVLLPGGGERHVTDREVKFGRRKAEAEELAELYDWLRRTGFPALDGYDEFLARLRTSFEYRALVNAWVVLRSREPPRSPVFKALYEYAKKKRRD